MNSSSCESFAALSSSSCDAEGFPYFRLYLIDSLNMLAACGTTPIAPRSDCCVTVLTSAPLIFTAPPSTS
jgi:hypothetical protein